MAWWWSGFDAAAAAARDWVYHPGKKLLDEGGEEMKTKLLAKKASSDIILLDKSIMTQLEQVISKYQGASKKCESVEEDEGSQVFTKLAADYAARACALHVGRGKLRVEAREASILPAERDAISILEGEAGAATQMTFQHLSWAADQVTQVYETPKFSNRMVDEGGKEIEAKLRAKKASTEATAMDKEIIEQLGQAIASYKDAASKMRDALPHASGETPSFEELGRDLSARAEELDAFLSGLSPIPRATDVLPEEKEAILYLTAKDLLWQTSDRHVEKVLHDYSLHEPKDGRLMEVIAAILSQWIYDAHPKSEEDDEVRPSIPTLVCSEASVHMAVHRVLEFPYQGNPAKLATVTATLPGKEPVLFVVFKGTSYLLDVIHWNHSHDFEFMGDDASFAHAGAASIIRQLKFLNKDEFLRRLECAYGKGVRQLILAGHSLGGCFSATLLWVIFNRPENLSAGARHLLESVRCISFGAPMSFGTPPDRTPSETFAKFLEFAQDRCVNFINENDPCPRAWSEIDMKVLVENAGAALKDGIGETYGGVIGGALGGMARTMGAPAVDEGVKRLLAQLDSETQIEAIGKYYQHVARIELMTHKRKGAKSLHWRGSDFQQSKEGLYDHSMDAYLECLLNLADSSRPPDKRCEVFKTDGTAL